MNITITSVKYSAFGNFESIDYSPANVSKLFNAFLKDNFVPNVITLYKIEQPQNTVSQVQRPQLLNNDIRCSISILPERVDIETDRELELENVVRYLTTISDLFQKKFSRLALNKSTVFNYLGKDAMERLCEMLAYPKNYDDEESLIELMSHRVSRKYIQALDEKINVGRNIEGVPVMLEDSIQFRQVRIDTDINTLGEIQTPRFDWTKCSAFFTEAINTDKMILATFEGVAKNG